MQSIYPKNAKIYSFDQNHAPKLTVSTGEKIEISTLDCFSNLVDARSTLTSIDWDHVNPATGPIYVAGAQRGDTLVITIHDIKLEETGIVAIGPGFGVLPFEKITHKVIRIDEEVAHFSADIKIPLKPMIGVIGVAPIGTPISTGIPGRHGGNLDTKSIAKGAKVYLPVAVDGALFALGDLHAAVGDGEIGGTGIEIAGKVTVSFDIMHNQNLTHPIVETENAFEFIASKPTIEEAVNLSVIIGVTAIQKATGLTLRECAMLGSITCDSQISQLVNPLLTARFIVPKNILPELV